MAVVAQRAPLYPSSLRHEATELISLGARCTRLPLHLSSEMVDDTRGGASEWRHSYPLPRRSPSPL
ncbi:hypothetical protein U1Q18_031085, partial [Sarracenia purpurea var. burkii]